jgi:hypothetical protein
MGCPVIRLLKTTGFQTLCDLPYIFYFFKTGYDVNLQTFPPFRHSKQSSYKLAIIGTKLPVTGIAKKS